MCCTFFVDLFEKEEKKVYFCLDYNLMFKVYEKVLYIIVDGCSDVYFGIVRWCF